MHCSKQCGLSGGCIVTVRMIVCAVMKFSEVCNYISHYYYYYYFIIIGCVFADS
jgi:hypothetical protein